MHTLNGDTLEAYIEGDDIALETDHQYFALTQEEARQLGERLLQLSRALETGEDEEVLEEIDVLGTGEFEDLMDWDDEG